VAGRGAARARAPDRRAAIAPVELADDRSAAIAPIEPIELDVALHRTPKRLTAALQAAIDAVEGNGRDGLEAIVLGYGLCSNAVLGLRARRLPLVVPRVDDCVALVLGSNEAFAEQARQAVGTYYLSRGWIDSRCTVFHEHELMVEKYGEERALSMTRLLLAHYTRLVLVDTGRYELAPYREFALTQARRFGLAYKEVPGTPSLVDALLTGPWDERFLIVRPGDTIDFRDFHPGASSVE